ncbi:MAG: TonB-dependent receptor [Planctomycetota bacterium]
MNALRPALLLAACAPLAAQQDAAAQDPAVQAAASDFDLEDLSLEELMQVPIEVGSRQKQSLADTAASVYVLNEQDIRRSGMRTVPELLRLVPGLVIAQDVPGAYGFSSRLGEYEFAGMLVLIDGQRLYTTLLRREYWQAIDLPLEIIERIEVVRGPGGSRWGDKASQGVINIVTKKANDRTHGLRVTGWAGSEERSAGSFRFGQMVTEDVGFYVFGKMVQRDGGYPSVSGDRWANNNVGARLDARLADGVDLAVDGLYHDSFLGDSYEVFPGFSSLNMIKGGHVKSRLHIDHGEDHWTEWRMGVDAYDQDIRDYFDNSTDEFLRYREQLFDTLLMHSWRVAPAHRITAGAVLRSLTVEYWRVVADEGEEYNETRGDLFASWDWDLCDELRVTIGANLGYQDGRRGSGVDTQPDLRVAWRPTPDTTVWTAFSANREPDTKIPDSGILVRRKASRLAAWELGLRQRFGEQFLLQLDGFAYEVSEQVNGETTDPGSGATLYQNGGNTHAFGGEATVTWRPNETFHSTVFAAVTEANTQNMDPNQFFLIEDEVPRLRGGMTLGVQPLPGLEIDTNVLYTQQWSNVPKWWRVDLRIGWRASDSTTIELVGQNLTDPHHQDYFYSEQAERSFFCLVTHRL